MQKNPKVSTAIFVVLVVCVGFLLSRTSSNVETTTTETKVPSVTVASVAALSSEEGPIMLVGEVRSVSQAELRAQKPGEVIGVYSGAGQFVSAGTVVAEIENSAERAAVLSAQGVLAAAEAQLQKVRAGDRSEDKASAIVQAESAIISLQSARDTARSAYSQAYSLAQNAVFAQADDFFSNPYTVSPSFRVTTATYDERKELGVERVQIGNILDEWKSKTLTTIPNDSLDAHLSKAENDLERIKAFLNKISSFVSEQTVSSDLPASTKSTQEAVILGARTSVDAGRSSVNGARSALAGAMSGAQVASLSESKSITGARSEDVLAAEAVVTQAKGALASASAALENTRMRTPIAGTVTTLNVSRGDFLTALQVVAVVANDGALEVELYVSDATRSRIAVDMPVLVDGAYSGVVTSVSPGLDPVTKKSRVTVGVADDAALVHGAFVEVAFLADESGVAKGSVATSSDLFIPITAIKVLPRGFAVFTVSEDNTLVAHPITEGAIVGSKMLVPEGLTRDMKIVEDVRGLSEGDVVEVVHDEQ